MPPFTLGIDIGTSSVKSGLLDLDTFSLIHLAARDYPNTPQQDPDKIWAAAEQAIRETVSLLEEPDQIEAVGLSGQMHGTVLFDSQGKILAPLINWQDRRCDLPLDKYGGRTTIEVMLDRMGPHGLSDLGVDTMASGFMGATLFYVREHDPELFSKVGYSLFPTDMIRNKLIQSSAPETDPTNAVGSGLYNARENRWQSHLIEKLGLPLEIFPAVKPGAQIAGEIGKEIAGSLGIKVGIPVIYGGGDLQMSLLGSGLVSPDSPALINIGSASQAARIMPEYDKVSGLETWIYLYGTFAQVGASLGGGINYHWLREKLRNEGHALIDYRQMDKMAASAPPGCAGLYFSSGPSRQDPHRPFGFFGNQDHLDKPGYAARAVLEGVIYDLYRFAARMGLSSHAEIVATGKGLFTSRIWQQIAADVFAKKLRITRRETAVMGAAILAGVGAGQISGLAEVDGKIKFDELHPNQSRVDFYKDWFISRSATVKI